MGRVRSAHKVKVKFYTQQQAALKLQLTLKLFRKLCILKGVFPREPKKRVGRETVYYAVKDITYMLHDPVIDTFRAMKSWKEKLNKSRARKDKIRSARLMLKKPVIKLDHMIKDRYPTFQSAIRDLDDCLTLIFTFSRLTNFEDLPEPEDRSRLRRCQKLCLEWEAYVTYTKCLRKAFISVKGIYYGAVVHGENITWLVPHQFSQTIPDNVNVDVMLSFLHLYETLLRFVLFKLYSEVDLSYPPWSDKKKEHSGLKLGALTLTKKPVGEEKRGSKITDEEAAVFGISKNEGETNVANLFKGLKFFISREVPNQAIELLIKSCGGTCSFDSPQAPYPESDESITHQIVDRPSQRHLYLSRVYVQPQWIFDCLNSGFLLPVSEYLVGLRLPPHLSPFVDLSRADYVPARAQEIEAFRAKLLEAKALEPESLDSDEEEDDLSDSDNDDTQFQKELETEIQTYEQNKTMNLVSAAAIAAEASAIASQQRKQKKATKEQQEKEEDVRLAESLIKGRKKRIYNAIKRNEKERAERVQTLLSKRR
eukprot:TRINITY_DN6029_c0_g1_i1.p1 TRINITY_DN6029_c0_g1~~TRINITY_DN6029_c0_g1_i1.p1  ORF type:complete len:545 (-),score=282.88 TRINITY_DN6029_c0_g1_i1:230-1843(-)